MVSVSLQSSRGRRDGLAAFSAHLLVALIALVVVGGATRVMEAGLACPDWPLCYGSFLPGQQMNLQVFLEWFHRLDAFVVGVGLLVLTTVSWWWRRELPRWFPPVATLALALVAIQAGLGALTVTLLLPFPVVTAHLLTALLLVALLSGATQALWRSAGPSELRPAKSQSHRWWSWWAAGSALLVLAQCLLGGLMATQWAAGRCIGSGDGCEWLLLHRLGARAVGLLVLLLAAVWSWKRPADRWLAAASALMVLLQIALGVLSLRFSLSVPAITIAHQLGAALLVALLSALVVRSGPELIHG